MRRVSNYLYHTTLQNDPMRLLLVEDNLALGEALREGLQHAGYAVNWVKDRPAAETTVATEQYDVIACDHDTTQANTVAFVKSARPQQASCALLIFGSRGTSDERIRLLDAGADEFLAQPFKLDELQAVIRALVRRRTGRHEPILRNGPLAMDPASRTATLAEAPLDISGREFAILEVLVENAGRVIAKSRLEEALYPWDAEIESNAVEVHVHRLRKKLGPGYIRTVRGIGYVVDKLATQQELTVDKSTKPAIAATTINGESSAHGPRLLATLHELYSRLERVIESQRSFNADAAREIGRSLSSVMLQAENALNAEQITDRTEALHAVAANATEANRILQMLVAMATVSEVAEPDIQRDVDLCKLCETTLAVVAQEAMAKSIELSLHRQCHGHIWARPDLLSLLVRSLASTVVDNARAGSRIEFTAQEHQNAVRLEIQSTPPATAPTAELENIETQSALDLYTARRQTLALALVRRIATMHDAPMHIQKDGEHICVMIDFPVATETRSFNWLI